jgi:hypothetical protein
MTSINRAMASNDQKKLTISFWMKRSKLSTEQWILTSYYSGSYWGDIRLQTDDTIRFTDYRNSYIMNLSTNAKLRDVNGFYHILCSFDNSVGSPQAKIYINGELQSLSANTNYSQNATTSWNTDYNLHIGNNGNGGSAFKGLISDFYFIQGYEYAPTVFGETDATTGEWKPKTNVSVNYSATGTNSCHLKFENSANLDLDSGNNNVSFTTSGTLTKTEDNPSNVFATLNPLQIPMPSETPTFENGNTRVYGNSSHWLRSYGNLGANSGKWWYELYIGTADASGRIGWDSIDKINDGDDNYHSGLTIQQTTGTVRGGIVGTAAYSPNAVQLPADGGGNATFAQGDYLGMGLDLDNNTITVYKNGSALATNWSYASYNTSIKSSTYGTFVSPSVNWYSGSGNQNIYDFNFGNGKFGSSAQLTGTTYTDSNGQGVFKYQPPTNYLAWCTKNLNV